MQIHFINIQNDFSQLINYMEKVIINRLRIRYTRLTHIIRQGGDPGKCLGGRSTVFFSVKCAPSKLQTT